MPPRSTVFSPGCLGDLLGEVWESCQELFDETSDHI